ncbi:hypothetical protein F4775DRAFT_131210 [Biscogniauxia sp. FL1348]|nr:hypothetical protein F4775DRAFT_131210 [Biscogniauxia sp. FL1348]
MKPAVLFLLAAACHGANAAWLRWSVDSGPVWSPQETSIGSRAGGDHHAGWTPKPTQAPGVKSEGEVVLDLLRRDDSATTTTWTNSGTCGWFAGISSSAVECGGGFRCETNTDHVVACVSATISNFYSACLDYSAYQAGSCDNLGPKTGCCTVSDVPACGTYLWTSSPERSMYKCFETASVITILDVPQFVIDASLASKSRAMTQTSTTSSDSSSSSTSTDPAAAATTTTAIEGNPSNSSTTTNIGAIVGGVIGGVAALALIIGCIAFLLCRRRRRKSKSKTKSTVSKEKTREVHHDLRTDTKEILPATATVPQQQQPPAAVKESSTTSSSPNARSSREARREARREVEQRGGGTWE